MFGEFPNKFPDGQVKYFYLDLVKMETEFLPGVFVPVRPFPGTLALARAEPGRYSTVPPGKFAGNLDINEFVEGSSIYIPIFVKGGLLWNGDSHAGQGNGEVNYDRDGNRVPRTQPHGRGDQRPEAGMAAHRDKNSLDHDRLRPRSEHRLRPAAERDGEVPGRDQEGAGRSRRHQNDGHQLGLPGQRSRERRQRHLLHDGEDRGQAAGETADGGNRKGLQSPPRPTPT